MNVSQHMPFNTPIWSWKTCNAVARFAGESCPSKIQNRTVLCKALGLFTFAIWKHSLKLVRPWSPPILRNSSFSLMAPLCWRNGPNFLWASRKQVTSDIKSGMTSIGVRTTCPRLSTIGTLSHMLKDSSSWATWRITFSDWSTTPNSFNHLRSFFILCHVNCKSALIARPVPTLLAGLQLIPASASSLSLSTFGITLRDAACWATALSCDPQTVAVRLPISRFLRCVVRVDTSCWLLPCVILRYILVRPPVCNSSVPAVDLAPTRCDKRLSCLAL